MLAACLSLGFSLSGCGIFASPADQRGNHIDSDQLKALIPGTSTRADVTALIGSPTIRAPFDDNTWIYISSVTQSRVARLPEVTEQNVVTLGFTENGVLNKIETRTKDDSQAVDVVTRTTPSPGSEASFFQQLFGNIGRFNALGSGQTASPGGGGAPKPY